MEDNPHLLLEGMALAGFAVGAQHGFILVALRVPALQAGARAGDRRGARATPTSTSPSSRAPAPTSSARRPRCSSCLQGLRGTVSARPPFPAERGVHGLPTVVNNVETLCNIPFIAKHGADAYKALSPNGTPGTKLVCFNERFAKPGLYEVPFGMTVRRAVRPRRRDGRGADQGAADRRPARRHPARLEARHGVRLRAAGRGGLHGRPRRDRRLRGAAPTCARSPSTCCTSAPPSPAGSASRAGSACSARTRCSPNGHPVDRDEARSPAGGARARQPVRPRRRHAGADPQPARALPGGAGARVIDAHDRRRGASPSRRGRRSSTPRPDGDPDALLRRAPGTVRRLPRVPGRRRGRARPGRLVHDQVRPGMVVDTQRRDRPARRERGRRARALRAPRPPGRAHRARAGRAHARRQRAALAGRAPTTSTTTSATRTSRFQHELVHLLRALRARVRRGPGHVRADRDRPRLRAPTSPPGSTRASRTRPASPAARAPTPARPTPSPRSPCYTWRGSHVRRNHHHHLRLLRRRLPPGGPRARRQGRLDQPRARRPRQRGPHLPQGPLRAPVLPPPRPPDHAADQRERRLPDRHLGGGDPPHHDRADAASRPSTARTRSPASPPRARPTRTATRCSA